jgi:hypothetical protein
MSPLNQNIKMRSPLNKSVIIQNFGNDNKSKE